MNKQFFTFIKIVIFLITNFIIFAADKLPELILLMGGFITAGLFSTNNLKKRLKIIIPLALFIAVFHLIFNTSVDLNSRIELGIAGGIRLILISISVFIFLAYTSFYELIRFFSFLPKNAVLVLSLTAYFIPRVLSDSDTISAVQKSRGMKYNSWNLLKTFAPLIVPLINRMFVRSEILSKSIISRGFQD